MANVLLSLFSPPNQGPRLDTGREEDLARGGCGLLLLFLLGLQRVVHIAFHAPVPQTRDLDDGPAGTMSSDRSRASPCLIARPDALHACLWAIAARELSWLFQYQTP